MNQQSSCSQRHEQNESCVTGSDHADPTGVAGTGADQAETPSPAEADLGPLLFCPRCGMPNNFDSSVMACRGCGLRYCPSCGNA